MREVHKKIAKIFPKMVDNEARKILDAGQPKPKLVEPAKPVEPIEPHEARLALGPKPCSYALEVYGSKVKAARALGIAETTFRDRLKKELAAP